jgi:hypothetical protein
MPRVDRESPNIPNEAKSVHKTQAENKTDIRKRHPEYHKMDIDDDVNLSPDIPNNGDGESPCCEPFHDIDTYQLDGFTRNVVGGTYSPSTTWTASGMYHAASRGGTNCATGDFPEDPSANFTFGSFTYPAYYKGKYVSSTLGTGAVAWPWNPGCGCGGLSFTFTGWRESSYWVKWIVPAAPADAAGVVVGPLTFNGHYGLAGGRVALDNGALLVVNQNEPTGVYDGTVVSVLPHGTETSLYVPIREVPAEGSTLWIGVIPGWRAQLGGVTCGFRWPWMDGKKNSGIGSVSDSSPFAVTWQVWDAAADEWGSGEAAGDDGAFFEGNLPWTVARSGGSNGIDGDNLYFTVASGQQESLVATMQGESTADIDDDMEDPVGDPWTSPYGVRMLARFKLVTAGSTTETGRRMLRFRWQDTEDEYGVTINLGDTVHNQGIVLNDMTHSVEKEIDIVEGQWMWVSLDTRNPNYIRAKMWQEQEAWRSGEPPIYDVQIANDGTSEADITGDFFEIAMSLGNQTGADQTVYIDGIWFSNGAPDGYWVQERIGQGNGVASTYAASMPHRDLTMWLFADGVHVPISVVDTEAGTFRSVDNIVADEDIVLYARYMVERDPPSDEEETEDIEDHD